MSGAIQSMVTDGETILAAIADVAGLAHTGWASQIAGEGDITALCPGAWIMPGACQQNSEAGRGRNASATRTWVVTINVAGDGRSPLEVEAAPLVEAVRKRLTGLALEQGTRFRRLRYAAEPEPFYAPGYIEFPIEFDAPEHITGDKHHE